MKTTSFAALATTLFLLPSLLQADDVITPQQSGKKPRQMLKQASPGIDSPGLKRLTTEALKYRENRLLKLKDFLKVAEEDDVLILDARSKQAYDSIHLKGAVHLNFSDFTEGKLAKVIGSKERKILIYCNNNFVTKIPALAGKGARLALNLPTFINLYGYGYRNVYELSGTVPVGHPLLAFSGVEGDRLNDARKVAGPSEIEADDNLRKRVRPTRLTGGRRGTE